MNEIDQQKDAQALLDNFDSAAWSIDSQYRLLASNSRFQLELQTVLGQQVALGSDLLKLAFPESSLLRWRGLYDRALAGEEFVVPQPSNIMPQRRVIEYHMRPLRAADGTIYGVSIFSRDVTAATQAAAEVQLHGHILNNLAEGVSLTSTADGTLVYTNPAFNRMFGYLPGEILGQMVSILNAPGSLTPDETAATIMQQLRQTGQWCSEIENIRKDGTRFFCRASVTTSRHPLYGPVWISLHQDISARLQAEADRRELQTKVMESQRLESLGVLAGGIAHDINNYLVPILGSASLLRADADLGSVADTLFAQIETAARHIRDLVQQILAFAGKGRLQTRAVRLDELVAELLPLLHSSISKSAQLELSCTQDLPSIDGDPAQLRQVLLNLILNASEALTDRPGVIRVALRPGGSGEDLGLPEPGAGAVVVEVADSGSGIATEIIGSIFDPFFTTKAAGRGLGLAAVLGIVRSHRGAIRVHQPASGGTVFCLAFPAGQLLHLSEKATASAPLLQAQVRRVLVVDDEQGVRIITSLMLQRFGYETITADGGDAALRILTQQPADIAAVLLDLTMPGRSGVETFHDIRRISPTLPIVIMSGYNADESLSPEILGDLAGLLTKPFAPDELQRLMVQALKEQQPQA